MPIFSRWLLMAMSFLMLTTGSCKRKLSDADLQNQLKQSMSRFLNESVHSDSSGIRFDVKEVTYFEERGLFDCRFIVRMQKSNGFDTTGTMTAKISKDFTRVKRIN